MSHPNPDCVYVLDLDSGTYFSLARAVLLDASKMSDDQIAILNEGSDMQRSELGDEIGEYLPHVLGWAPDWEREEVMS